MSDRFEMHDVHHMELYTSDATAVRDRCAARGVLAAATTPGRVRKLLLADTQHTAIRVRRAAECVYSCIIVVHARRGSATLKVGRLVSADTQACVFRQAASAAAFARACTTHTRRAQHTYMYALKYALWLVGPAERVLAKCTQCAQSRP